MNREYRVGKANQILATFMPSVMLYHSRELRMCWGGTPVSPKHDFPARLRSEGSLTLFGYRQRPTGGTGMQALAQIIRYVRDLHRFPMATWEYWASDTVKLCKPETLERLRESDYQDANKTCCVLCGDPDFKRGLDWWSLDGVVGPSCKFGCCAETAL